MSSRPTTRRFTFTRTLGLFLFPAALLSFYLALRFPLATESLYSRTLYPFVARSFASANRVSFSLAEPLAGIAMIFVLWYGFRFVRQPAQWRRALAWTWCAAGIVTSAFLALWGFNYARPPLAERARLKSDPVEARAVLDAGERAARMATVLFDRLGNVDGPTSLPFTLSELNARLDDAFTEIGLPGDQLGFPVTPAKPLVSSMVFSYLGISGIFVPFTGEPSFNALQPDVALPIVVAHEKAHQRGVTHEGEASFAAFLACAHESSPLYFRYAAYLFAARYLIGEASIYLPREEVATAWEQLGDGPREDLRAIAEFWRQYAGPAQAVATEVNDQYLRALQVEGGVESYGTVVQLLMALDARGDLAPEDF